MYAENSDKSLVQVIPTTFNQTGYVREWEVYVSYTFPAVGYTTSSVGYAATVNTTIEVGSLNLAPTGFTSTGILSTAIASLDKKFNHEYELANNLNSSAKTEQVGFAITSLSV